MCSWKKKYKNPVFLWQEYHVVVTTKCTLLYIIITSSCEYMLCTWWLKMRRLKKKHLLHIYIQQTPKLRAVEEKETTFGINFYHTWFYFIFLRNCDHFYFMDGDALIMRDEEEKIKLHVCKKKSQFLQLFLLFGLNWQDCLEKGKTTFQMICILLLLLTCLLLMCWRIFSRKKTLLKIMKY